jgi:two-component system, NarL family, response regulator DegU
MSLKNIRIAVADDQALFRQGIISLLKEFPDLQVVIEASDGANLLTQLKEKPSKKPDVILMDLEMPNMDGIAATKTVKSRYPDIRIIVVTLHAGEEMALYLMNLGAAAFIPKGADIDVVVKTIRAVHSVGYYISEETSRYFYRRNSNKRAESCALVRLSEREKDVVKLICKQKSLKEIAEALSLSHRTIESHKASILEKTNSKNTAGIVIYALKNNLIESLY